MSENPRLTWNSVQARIDACAVCRADRSFETAEPRPCRPPDPKKAGRLLFVSEAPPITGGFWCVQSGDVLRKNLFDLLGKNIPRSNSSSQSILAGFLEANFFLIQAFKWSFAKDESGERLNFNKIGTKKQRALIDHAVLSHVRDEMLLIAPKGILAMGNAALEICRRVSEKPFGLPSGRVEALREGDYDIVIANRKVPTNVTYLPVGRNMRNVQRAQRIRSDIEHFLRRHN